MTTENFGGASHNETRTPEQSGAATGDGAVNSKERAPIHMTLTLTGKCKGCGAKISQDSEFCATCISPDGFKATAPKWILVAQELPPEGEIVLTFILEPDGREWCARYLKHLGGRWLSTHDEPPIYTPTHWARD